MVKAGPMTGLYLSNRDRILRGVCGGIAEWLGWSPTIVRLAYVIVSLASAAFPGMIVYCILWMLMPRR